MLSIDECRQTLGLPELSDEEVAEIRDTLYAFAQAFIDGIVQQSPPTPSSPPA